MREWGRFCKQNGKKPKKFPRDVPHRWNSTYELLNQSFSYKELLCTFFANYVPQSNLYPQEWDICKRILDLLKVFNNATYTLSGVYYPTTHLFLTECLNIVDIFQENEGDNQLGPTIIAMRTKWMQYYTKIPIIYLVACVLDPRTKMEGLLDDLNSYYECLHLIETVNIRDIEKEVKDIIVELYNDFCNRYNIVGDSGTSSQVSGMQGKHLGRGSRNLINRQKRQKGIMGNISEIEIYLTTEFEFPQSDGIDFQILKWWNNHSTQFPVLAHIAKEILVTPCSTVAVEQAFSIGGNILDDRRSRLSPDSVEVQICVDDWTKAAYRQQEMDRNIESEFFNDEDITGTGTTATGSDD